ncbi:MAG TPA: winged helix-turn-helix transcriptional regulator [Mycobacteriales bacterium]|nr:winged helix-turn-helix transcriptional regulator [Mycobacteriales bacterium]
MPTTRSYGDACGMARALDVVGERWAVLVVRELTLGPRRFSDLRRSLPNASSNLLSDRLRELRQHGVLERRRLAPPAASWVYELTELGRRLEPILIELGKWGLSFPPPEPSGLSATSVLLYLRSHIRPQPGMDPVTVGVELDDQLWTVRVTAAKAVVTAGEPARCDVSVHSDPASFDAVLHRPSLLRKAIAGGRVKVSGNLALLGAVLDRLPAD